MLLSNLLLRDTHTFLNYIVLNVNSCDHAILLLLDLSAAFDTIDYNMNVEHCGGR